MKDATVVSVLDGLPDQRPGKMPEGIQSRKPMAIRSCLISAAAVTRSMPTCAPARSKSNRRPRETWPSGGTRWQFRQLYRAAPALPRHECAHPACRQRATLRIDALP